VLREPLGLQVPWPAADLTFAPAGFIPSSAEAGASAPICPPGLALAMAPFALPGTFGVFGSLGDRLPFLVVPLFGGWAVWLTWVIGRRVGGSPVGLSGAALLACSPIFLYQIVQPMSDILAAALWLAAIVALMHWTEAGSMRGGLAAGIALLVRPNLLPLAITLGVFGTVAAFRLNGPRRALAAAGGFAVGLVPGVVAILALQWMAHGSPLRTGYGDPDVLFSIDHVIPDLRRYVQWLYEAHGPVLGLALIAPLVAHGERADAARAPATGLGLRWVVALLCVQSCHARLLPALYRVRRLVVHQVSPAGHSAAARVGHGDAVAGSAMGAVSRSWGGHDCCGRGSRGDVARRA